MEGFARDDSPAYQKAFEPLLYGLSRQEQLVWMEEHKQDAQIPMGPYHMYRPCGLFHRMLEPLAPFSIKGVLWYQGESDSGHAHLYGKMLKGLIENWRALWKDAFPFLIVQLAPFGVWLDCTNDGYAQVRQQQEWVSRTVADTYMVSIMDIGMYEDIHPKKKKEVGERLALLARGCVYGEEILCQSPELEKVTVDKNVLKLHFLHTGNALSIEGEQCKSLRVIKDQQEIIPVSIRADKDVLVAEFAENLHGEIAIHFADTDYAEVNVYNEAGLPVKPFNYTVVAEEPMSGGQ